VLGEWGEGEGKWRKKNEQRREITKYKRRTLRASGGIRKKKVELGALPESGSEKGKNF
jgi:hypothetical protein